MKIIDYQRKGNVIRFYLGLNTLADWTGDDWDDAPYEHNAGPVYRQYITGFLDVAIPFDCDVLAPHDGTDNSCYTKNDLKHRVVPCILIVPKPDDAYNSWSALNFDDHINDPSAIKIYCGDDAGTLLLSHLGMHVMRREIYI